ncbi:MAG TPA: ABC transporter ATP-binding protein [Devosia sp.]|nr:ABC transporter ATP-binding protein [Devosia sp.]
MLRWFETRLDPYPSEFPRMPPRRFWDFCLHYMDGTKRWLALMALTAGVIGLLEIMLFAFMGSIIDWLSSVDRATFFQTEGNKLILMSVVLLVIFPVFAVLNTLVIHQTLAGNFPQRIRWMAHRYLLRQSMAFFQDEFAGRIAAKLMQTALAVREVVMKLLDILLYVVIYFLGALVLIASSDWRLVVPLVIWFAIYLGLLRYFVPRLGKIAQAQADARSMMTGRIVDSYTNISTVKLFSHSAREEEYAHDALEEFLATVHKQMRLGTWLEAAIDILNTLLLFSITGLGLLLWQQSIIGAGTVAVGIAIAIRLQGMSHWIMWEMSALFENIGTVRDGINTIALPSLVHDAPDAKELKVSEGAIQFANVTFKYDRGSANDETPLPGTDNARDIAVIDGFDLSIRPGEKIGLVGRSGAGKSTLVSLVLRFYDLAEGRITIDGTDISTVTQESLRGAIGVVSQDTSLLHRSVRQNVKYGRPDASDEEMIKAAELAEAHEFILDLEDARGNRGYDAHVGERGVKLSGGQRQRIAIARVLLKDAPILVLDEATSALDSEVEAAIQGQFEMLMQNKTVIAIAHRLSTIAAMDRLIVLDEGKIVEQGTHDELVDAGGTYARLWARQSGGFLQLDEEEVA